MTWYVAQVERHRERPFAKEVEAMGFAAWVAMETRYPRHQPRKSAKGCIRDRPCLPGIAFVAVPGFAHGDLQTLRYPCSLLRDVDGYALAVSDQELQDFRAELDKVNRHNKRCYDRMMQGKIPGKRKNILKTIREKYGKATLGNLADVLADVERLEVMDEAA